MAFNPLDWLRTASAIERLFALEAKLTAILEKQADEIDQLKRRVDRLEVREEVLIVEAKGAAAAAASVSMAELSRRIGVIEGRTQSSRLPQPE